jgi:long-subunit fatty acid transport protein
MSERTDRLWRRGFLCSLVAVFSFSSLLAAQNTNESNAFDFSLPGARSRGIGGAFVALADDATAAYSNPAGLTQLFRPEVSIEGRYWNFSSLAADAGHAFGPASGIGIDTVNGVVDREFESGLTGLSFLSFVYPEERWSVGVFYHQLARYEMERQIQGAFFDCQGGFRGEAPSAPFCEPHARDDGVDRDAPRIQHFDLDIRSIGTAVAFDVTETFAVGFAVQYFDFTLDARNRVFAARGSQKYLPADYTDPDNIEVVGIQRGEDNAWAANLGIMWHLSEQWTAGASFRQGPRFRFLAQTSTGPANPGPPGEIFVNEPDNPFKVPDTFALGAAFRPSNSWRVGLEYDFVKFSQLVDDFREVATRAGDPEGQAIVDRLTIDDAHQFRLGAEYVRAVFGSRLLAFRGGVWYDPSHQPFLEVDDAATGFPAPRWALLFPERDGNFHWSAGFGFATRTHFQIDVAADISDAVRTVALSSIWRF